MKKSVIIIAALLMAVTAAAENEQKKTPASRQEQKEQREQHRAERIANYQKTIDSLVKSRNFQFNPQTMQREPAGVLRQIMNPTFSVGIWDGTADICLPYVKGYVAPYYISVINTTVTDLRHYTTEQTHDGWLVSFGVSLFSAADYTFTFEIYSSTGGANLTITNPYYSPVQYTGTITQMY